MSHVRAIPRYLVVGGACALLANVILIGFDQLHINYAVSSVVAFVTTLLIAYTLHADWTFGAERSLVGLLRYGTAMAINLPLSIALLFVLIDVLGFRMAVAAPAATVLQTVINYLLAANTIRARSVH
jgi:putative flippase GtrA